MTHTCEIKWNSVEVPAPQDRRILIAACRHFIKTGRCETIGGIPCFVCDSGTIVPAAFAWAELPDVPDRDYSAVGSSAIKSSPDSSLRCAGNTVTAGKAAR